MQFDFHLIASISERFDHSVLLQRYLAILCQFKIYYVFWLFLNQHKKQLFQQFHNRLVDTRGRILLKKNQNRKQLILI